MNFKETVQSKTFKGFIFGIAFVLVLVIIFQTGITIGERRSDFAHRFGDNFERNFRGPDKGMLLGGHGAVGEIISLALPQVLVSGPDNLEKTVIIGPETVIREFQTERTAKDLEVGGHIVVLGEPNSEGQINAKLIRLLPPPPDFTEDKLKQ